MADKTFNTRILLKYDTYENWTTNNPTLKAGEMAIATIASGNTQEVNSVTAPQVLIKVGDGTSAYNALPFISSKSADVYSWAKAAEKPTYEAKEITGLETYINTTIQDTDTQYKMVKVTDYQYKLMSKAKDAADYTVEVAVIDIPNDTAAITALQNLVGDVAVSAQITNALAAYSTTAQMTSAISAAKAEAVAHADGLNTSMNTRVEALEAIDHSHTFVEAELNKIQDGDVAKWNAAEQNAKDHADDLNTAMDGRVADLEAMFGDGEGTVEAQIEAAVAAEKERAEGIEAGLRTDVDAIKGDYLKGSDKTELAGDISDNADEISALKDLVGTTAVSSQISAAVAAEAEIARAAEKTNADAIDAIEADYLKAADKQELTNAIATAKQEAIATVLGEGTDADFDTLKEVADWILSDTTGAAGLQKDVADIKADYLKGSDKTELQGNIDALANGAVKTNTEAIATLNGTGAGSVDKKIADAIAAENLSQYATDGELTAATGRISTLEGEMDQAQADIGALEDLVGTTGVSAQISAAIEALKIGDYAKAADLVAAVGRISTVEGKVATLEGEMDTAQADIDALETEIVKKANDADLAAVAKSGLIDDLSIGEGTVLVFDCGDSNF